MDTDVISAAIDFGLQKLSFTEIKINQRKVVESFLAGKDVFFCSPTGSGKSLTFEIAPFVFKYLQKNDMCIVLVISPLTSLMRTQTQALNRKGIKAVYLKDITSPSNFEDSLTNLSLVDVKEGKIDIIFSSPESLIGHERKLLLDLAKKIFIKTVFVDEAHCIKKLPCYGRLDEIRSLVGGHVPVVALTATATEETKAVIKKQLCMDNCSEIMVNPDKKNVTYWVHNLPSDDICTNFRWLVNLLRGYKQATSRMIIFFRQIKHMADVYEYLETSLKHDAYIDFKEGGPNDNRNRLFDMFHMKTDDDVKDFICTSYMNPNANDVDDYVQESGRAGREPSQQCNAILLTYKRCLGSQNIFPSMKEYVKSKTCRRAFILNIFKTIVEHAHIPHFCCDICRLSCKCACSCEDECVCTNTCNQVLPKINTAIMSNEDNDDSDDNDDNDITELDDMFSSDSDSDVLESSTRKPQVIYSSDDEMF
ncbi:recQ [Mytilus edulis]|uniref:RecQ n=1 Tax=Mytilus edulis TaxID=6550 RepID=A0A8S3TQ17_MYTED|nr:recQ [Mytilus edulis]